MINLFSVMPCLTKEKANVEKKVVISENEDENVTMNGDESEVVSQKPAFVKLFALKKG
jgi:hypothetical protein